MSTTTLISNTAKATIGMDTINDCLFDSTAPTIVGRRLGFVSSDTHDVARIALLVVVIGWLPLIILAIVQGLWTGTEPISPLIREVGVHVRYAFAAPALVLAGVLCAPQLNIIAQHFRDSGIVDERDRSAVDEAINSARRLLRSPIADLVMLAPAYLVAVVAAASYSADQLPVWAKPTGLIPRLSLAGWWHTLVSLPLLLVLIFGWFWQLAVWTQFLWRVSQLRLRLVASHPDRSAGLGFLSQSVSAFAIAGTALSSIVAGRSAHVVLQGGALPTQHLYFDIGLMLALLALFVAPLLAFMPPLLETWRRGTLKYDMLAERIGHAFEQKWLGTQNAGGDALDKPDFSATADLYGVVANVHAIRFIPLEIKDLIALAVPMALPFAPVILLAFPLESIWAHIKSLLL